jgi:hypothetical protein
MLTMTPDTAASERLNDLLIELGRSLLQYACEAWPWSSAADGVALRTAVRKLGARQREAVAALADQLDGEGHNVDFGVYPDEYTSLHYVSLRYLLDQLIASEEGLVADCQATSRALAAGSPAHALVTEITREEQSILDELRSLKTH